VMYLIMRKRDKIALACLSFLIGLILSSFLLRFLFGTSIYSKYNYYGLLAPSFSLFSLGRVDIVGRGLSGFIDASIFGGIIYSVIHVYVLLFREEKYS
jgi:hypothetical protein